MALAAGRRFVAARAPLLRSSLGSAILLGLRFVQARLISVWGLIIVAALCPPFVFAAFGVFSGDREFRLHRLAAAAGGGLLPQS